ncbi:MAG: cytochrome c [Rhodospirillales bacterium]|nr:cytochrome c [Rhodospirillales bacterium]
MRTEQDTHDGVRARRRSNRALAAAALAAVLAAALPVPGVAGEGSPSPARTRELAYLVRQDCGSCHGMTLKGGLGSPLLPELLAGKHEDALAAIILDGIPGTPMPPWRPLLTEAEAGWIARALKEGLP